MRIPRKLGALLAGLKEFRRGLRRADEPENDLLVKAHTLIGPKRWSDA